MRMPMKVAVLSKISNLMQEIQQRMTQSSVIDFRHLLSDRDKADCKSTEILVADFDLFGPILYDLKDICPNLKFVQGTWAGIDSLKPFLDSTKIVDVPILRFSGRHFGRLITEYVLATIVNHERAMFNMYQQQKQNCWSKDGKIGDYRSIFDLNVGVMGVGHIGSHLIESLKMFGASVQALGRRKVVDSTLERLIHEYFSTQNGVDKSRWTKFFQGVDYIINTLPSTEETKGLLNGNILAHCKDKSPVFINVGRGDVISEEFIMHALENKWLSHAYLDVFSKEPLPDFSKLWQSNQITVTPHVAACSRAKDIAEQLLENYKAFTLGDKISTQINFQNVY